LQHQRDEEGGLEGLAVRLVRGLLVGLDEACVVRDLINEREAAPRFLDRGRVDFAELGLRRAEPADERPLRRVRQAGGILAEALPRVELLVDLEPALEAEGFVVHRWPASWRERIKPFAGNVTSLRSRGLCSPTS